MSIGRATLYGIAALIYLARRQGDRPATVQEISQSTGMPVEYLRKLLSRLIKHGLVQSVRGRRGGFLPVEPRQPITLLSVREAMEGPLDADSVFERDLLQFLDGQSASKLDEWRHEAFGIVRTQLETAELDRFVEVEYHNGDGI